MKNIEVLTTRTYQVLRIMDEHKESTNVIKMTQAELGHLLNLTSMSISNYMKVLREMGLIEKLKNAGRYKITNKGLEVVVLFNKLEDCLS